jgi:hypothetical protein
VDGEKEEAAEKKKGKAVKSQEKKAPSGIGATLKKRVPVDVAIGVIMFFIWFLTSYVYHSTYMAAEAYSSPSIILASRR